VLQVGIDSSLLRIKEVMTRECGFQFDDLNTQTLEECVQRRMKVVAIGDYSEYEEYLLHHPDGAVELQHLIQATTINQTNFFRHPGQMEALKTEIVPDIFERKMRCGELVDPILSVWSAGCSTGDETYSIALQIRDALDPFYAKNVEILGTDIDEHVLSLARNGSYGPKTLQWIGERHLEAYFVETAEGYKVNEELRSNVRFEKHNLVTIPYPSARWGKWDVIFCRNVIIYFNEAMAKRVIANLYDSLAYGGYLVLGYSESLGARFDDLTLCEYGDAFVYRKDDEIRGELHSDVKTRSKNKKSSRRKSKEDEIVEKIKEHLARDEYGQAEKQISALLRVKPGDATTHLLSACLYLETGDHDKAAEAAMHAIALDPLQAHAYFVIAVVCETNGDHEAAIRYLRRALYLDETLAMAHFHLALIYKRLGRQREAMREFRNTIGLLEKVTSDDRVEFIGGVRVSSILEVCRKDLELM
jgi:chemotaxis protein methyltransferase CheR